MQPMNINITNSKETSETEDYSEFEKYIIKNNVHLNKENKQLREQITELEKQNNEHESENDKYDERIRYMRGLMHNLYSLKEMSTSVRNNWEEHSKKSNKLFKKYNDIDGQINKIIAIYIVNLVIILLIDLLFNNNYIILIKMIIYNSAIIALFSTSYKKYIINDNLYKIFWCQNSKKIVMKYNEEYYNLKNLQDDLENQTKEKMKEINELEKVCVGVSVMIDNV
jgi:FtsZ-binding cell division protein ZapB